jgi:hypothetical protein
MSNIDFNLKEDRAKGMEEESTNTHNHSPMSR